MDSINAHLAKLAELLQMEIESVPVGFPRALDEMGPNHLTEFADALEIEGYPKPPGGHFPMWESIGTFRDELTSLIAGKNVAFAGGVVVRSYGARTGPTMDYDLLIDLSHQKELWAFLEKRGFEYRGPFENTDKFHHKELHLEVDLIRAEIPLFTEALASARTATWRDKRVKIVNPDYLAAMKVKAYSERRDAKKKETDRRDVIGLLKTQSKLENVRNILGTLRPDLLPELDEILSCT